MRATRPPRPARLRPLAWIAITLVWVALLTFGLHQRFLHATTAGAAGMAPAQFPEASHLARVPGHSTLLMFVHPECPCTRASLHELAGLLAGRQQLTTQLVIAPTMASEHSWADSPSAAIAREILSLTLFEDRDGVEGQRFGAETSGFAVLYDVDGSLRFAGGITGSRGHIGENMGLAELRKQLADQSGDAQLSAVYGCPLHAQGERTGDDGR